VIELYRADGITPVVDPKDDGGEGEDEVLEWICDADGVYYVKVRHYDRFASGENTEYDLQVYVPIGPLTGFIGGTITNAYSSEPIEGVRIKTDGKISALSFSDGAYFMVHPAGTFTITAEAPGYAPASFSGVLVGEGGTTIQNIALSYPNDSDGDGMPDWWEVQYFGNLDRDGTGDWDGDGLIDLAEFEYGTNPTNPDSDGDGFTDGDEVGAGTDPNDPQSHPSRAMPWIPLLLLDD